MRIGEPKRTWEHEPDLIPVVLPTEQPVKVDWPIEAPVPVELPEAVPAGK